MRLLVSGIVGAFSLAILCTSGSFGGGDKQPKYTTKKVMAEAHKKGLMKKVAEGTASADEKKLLVEYYVALAQNKSKSGEAADWSKKTEALVKLAKQAADGKDVGKALAKAANCKACHDAHK